MTMRISTAVANGLVDNAVDRIDVGASNGTMEFYSGVPPATLAGAPAGDLLAVIDFQEPAMTAADADPNPPGQASAIGVPITTTGVDAGDIGFARVVDGGAAVLWDDDDVGTSGNNIEVNTATVSVGVDFQLTSYAFTAAAGP